MYYPKTKCNPCFPFYFLSLTKWFPFTVQSFIANWRLLCVCVCASTVLPGNFIKNTNIGGIPMSQRFLGVIIIILMIVAKRIEVEAAAHGSSWRMLWVVRFRCQLLRRQTIPYGGNAQCFVYSFISFRVTPPWKKKTEKEVVKKQTRKSAETFFESEGSKRERKRKKRWFISPPASGCSLLPFIRSFVYYTGAITRQRAMAVIQKPTPSFFIYSPFLFRQNILNSSFFFISFFALKVSYSRERRENQHMGGIVIRLIPPSAIWYFDYILVYQTLPLT